MHFTCSICNQVSTEEQPLYCLFCFVPITPYQSGKFLSTRKMHCPNCKRVLGPESEDSCTFCLQEFDLENLPTLLDVGEDQKIRDENRAQLINQLENDPRQAQEMLEILGISTLPSEEQGVALSSLAKEKMHVMSGDYNFTEAKTLTDLGAGLAKKHGKSWAVNLTEVQRAAIAIRAGSPHLAAYILGSLFDNWQIENSDVSLIEKLRFLEIESLLALAHRLAGNQIVAALIADQAHENLEKIFYELEPQINTYLRSPEIKSEYIGFDLRETIFPRVDLISTALVIQVEEIIARGSQPGMIMEDQALQRLLELDNVIKILGEMTPQDDPVFFAAHFRDYARLVNAVFWYGDILINNDGALRRLLIERIFDRVEQWIQIIPVQFWMALRPTRFLEAFYRAEVWSEHILTSKITDAMLDLAPRDQKPSFLYMIAESKANTQQFIPALQDLRLILSDLYADILDDTIRALAERLELNIELEMTGILTGVSKDTELFKSPITLEIDSIKVPFAKGSYLDGLDQKPRLRLYFEMHEDVLKEGIAIFGDRLAEVHPEMFPNIISVKDMDYKNRNWNTPYIDSKEKDIQGYRMDAVVIRLLFQEEELSLLFEGKKQDVVEKENEIIFNPTELLLLRGVIFARSITFGEIVELLAQIQQGEELPELTIFTLKSRN